MKRTILTLAITLIAATFVFGQSKDEQEIRKTLNTIADALVKNDVATLANYYADNYTFINGNGEMVNKTQRLERAKNARFQTFSYGDLNIRQMGNTAVVLARPTQTIKLESGEIQNLQDRATLTMAKMNGRWQIVAIQTSPDNPATGNLAETEKQIGELMTNWGNALGRRDAATVEKILPADLMIVSPDGKMTATRAEYLEVVKSFSSDATVTGKSEKTIISGDTAVQTGTYSVTPKASGAKTMNYRYTATFVRRNGRWMPIAFNSRAVTQ